MAKSRNWSLPRSITAFAHSTRGATAIEYALIASLIALVIIGGLTALGTSLSGSFTNTTNAIDNS